MIYIVYNSELNAIKIRYSKNPIKRLTQLQTANSVSLQLLHTEKRNVDKEKEIHSRLNNFRLKGEWFDYESCETHLPLLLTNWVDLDLFSTKVSYNFLSLLVKWDLTISDLQLIGYLIDKYPRGEEFNINTNIRKELAKQNNKSPSTYNNSTRNLLDKRLILPAEGKSYRLNPTYVWKGNEKKQKKGNY